LSKLTRLVLYVFYFLAVIALGAVIVMSFTSKHTTKIPKVSHATVQATSTGTGQAASQSSTQTKPSHKVVTASAPKMTKTTSSTGMTTPSTLENTGPGNIVYLFVVASAVGYFVYRRILVRKLNRN
jgi:uncharacterized protein YneF (UPF0154 family)